MSKLKLTFKIHLHHIKVITHVMFVTRDTKSYIIMLVKECMNVGYKQAGSTFQPSELPSMAMCSTCEAAGTNVWHRSPTGHLCLENSASVWTRGCRYLCVCVCINSIALIGFLDFPPPDLHKSTGPLVTLPAAADRRHEHTLPHTRTKFSSFVVYFV